MKKIIGILLGVLVSGIALYFAVMYYATFSEGIRSGELIKISNKGMIFKTWEGELSQGIAGAQIFKFSILDSDQKIIQQMKDMQGEYVKVNYIERYRTFPWWGDTQYYITDVEKEDSPFKVKLDK